MGPDHKFSCRDSRPVPIAMDAPCCAPTSPITRRSAPLIINNLPTAPDEGNAKKASELPAPARGALAQAVCQARCRQRGDEANADDGRQRALPSLSLPEEPCSFPRTRGRTAAAATRWEKLPGNKEEEAAGEASSGGSRIALAGGFPRGNRVMGEAPQAPASPGTVGDRAALEVRGAAPRHRPR